MTQDVRAKKALSILKKAYPQADCALSHKNPVQLLVATILSAQCTDKRVNMVTPSLFRKYRSAKGFADAVPGELEREIRSTGFFRQKARWIRAAAAKLVSDWGGGVPRTMEDLLELPGVARKTANVVLGTGFGISSGIVVDTHVKRVAKRLGLTRRTDPVKVEEDLVKVVPKKDWIWFSHAVITHGRLLCSALNPKCFKCPMNSFCPASEA
ncbi:MAG: endonuclease III [Elusimicrobia bacterium RIFCSPLOWO2_01_FULL_64_13]|nr:MAG: endonuclease III [Elusimicrobia bacterium RIFCSPLOWO2_01_FULL_64_13]